MSYTIEELKKAIKEANDCLECNEGVDLLYYMQGITQDKESIRIIEEILNESDN